MFHCPSCKDLFAYDQKENKYFCARPGCENNTTPFDVIDISYQGEGFEKALSNLCPYDFQFSRLIYSSMEGFLRSLVEPDLKVQKEISKLSGVFAFKIRGALRDWRIEQTLYFEGEAIKRESDEYFSLISKAFDSLFYGNPLFKKILLSTKGSVLIHSIGSTNQKETLLPADEYIFQLNRLRNLEDK